jgi:hypothetical protein
MFVWSLEAQTDSRLNGNWFGVAEGIDLELRINNGNYEALNNGVFDSRGTYTANNGELTLRPTHVFGGAVNASAGFFVIESKWYTINEFIIAIRDVFLAYGIPEEEINAIIQIMISPPPASYSVDADTLIVTSNFDGNKYVTIYTQE